MSKRYSKRCHQGRHSWRSRVPQHVWLLGEVLVLLLVLHYVPMPLYDLLPLIKMLR